MGVYRHTTTNSFDPTYKCGSVHVDCWLLPSGRQVPLFFRFITIFSLAVTKSLVAPKHCARLVEKSRQKLLDLTLQATRAGATGIFGGE